MNILKSIIERLNQKLDASNIYPSIYGLAQPLPDNKKAFVQYDQNGQNTVVTDYDKTDGTIFWTLRSAVTVREAANLAVKSCKEMYISTYPLRGYSVVKKKALPCDSNAAEGWLMDMFWKYVSGKDTQLKANLGVTNVLFRPISVNPNTPDLPDQFEYCCLYFDIDVEITAMAIESCYDDCGVNPIPLPNGQCPPINRVVSVTGLNTDNTDPSKPIIRISVDGSSITGSGTPDDPLVAIGGGGGGSNLRVQDEGTTVTNAATTLNFTGNVTASLASAGNVTVNVPAPTPQVNADWNASSGVAEILNKPNIPAAQIQSDWNQSDNAALDFIKNKPSIPSIAGLVPYTGANQDVDLGAFKLNTHALSVTGTNGNGHIHLRHQASDATATGQSTAIFADSNGDIKIKNDGLSYATFKTSLITSNRIYTFPDKSGTVAMTSDVQTYTEGTGIDITSNVITNTAPDQTVVLNEGTGIDVTGTYPNFTIANTAPDQTVVLNAGTGIGISGTYPNFTVENTQNSGVPTKMVVGGATETSGTSITQLNSLLIEGGWVSSSKMLKVFARNYKAGANGASTIRLYINTVNNLSGAVLIATFQASATQTTTYQDILRRMVVLSATETFTALVTQSLANDIGNGFYSILNIDWTTDKYLIATGQDANGSDVTKNLILSLERHENS